MTPSWTWKTLSGSMPFLSDVRTTCQPLKSLPLNNEIQPWSLAGSAPLDGVVFAEITIVDAATNSARSEANLLFILTKSIVWDTGRLPQFGIRKGIWPQAIIP